MNSNMKAVMYFFVIALAVGSVLGDMAGECHMAGYYLELGCTPLYKNHNFTCPYAFTCPNLHTDQNMCYYKGVAYRDGSTIPQYLIEDPCTMHCRCSLGWNPTFDCSIVDCYFGNDFREDCITTHDLDSCCSKDNSVCGTNAIAKLATCEVEGKTYYAGQIFELKNYRKTCVCTADWDGEVVDRPYCRDLNCGLEIHYQTYIQKKCAPVFYETRGDCPISYKCPSATTKISRRGSARKSNSVCVFGDHTLRVGDTVSSDERCVTCSCEVPPFVSCHEKSPC